MVLASFQIKNNVRKAWFFQKIFLVANINLEIILIMLFFNFNNANIVFKDGKLIGKSYIRAKAL